jgi:Protein of unknown function (DUF2628).
MQNPFGNNNQNNQDFFNNLPIPPNYAKIKNDEGEMRIAKVGFSWTVFLFGPFPALFRNDWYNFFFNDRLGSGLCFGRSVFQMELDA